MSSAPGKWLVVWRDAHGWHTFETDFDEESMEMEEGLTEDSSITHVAALSIRDYETAKQEED